MILITSLLLTACKTPQPPVEKPVYNKPQTTVSVAEETIPLETDNTEIFAITNKQFLDFSGVTATENSPVLANSPYANISHYGTPSPSCFNAETGEFYYVNFGKYNDNFLYSYRDGKSELAIDMMVNYPSIVGDNIYFVSSENQNDLYGYDFMPKGKLYKYNLVTEEITQLYDKEISRLYTYKDYLYFNHAWVAVLDQPTVGGEAFRMSIATGEVEQIGDFLPLFYGEYQLKAIRSGDEELKYRRALGLVSGDETVMLTDFYYDAIQMYINYTIDGDTFWTISPDRKKLSAVNLNDAKRQEYLCNDYNYIDSNGNAISETMMKEITSFVVIKGEVFVVAGPSTGGNIYKYDRDNSEFMPIAISERRYYTHIFTDGNDLYAISIEGITTQKHGTAVSIFLKNPNGEYVEEIINL